MSTKRKIKARRMWAALYQLEDPKPGLDLYGWPTKIAKEPVFVIPADAESYDAMHAQVKFALYADCGGSKDDYKYLSAANRKDVDNWATSALTSIGLTRPVTAPATRRRAKR